MDTWNTIVTIATPIIITGVVGIVVKLIYNVGDIVIGYLKTKKEESGLNAQLVQHKEEITTAKQVWNIIEEKYRITETISDLIVSKADMFDDLLLKKIPYLTKENLVDLRQSIAGEFNKGKEAIITDASLKTSQVELTNNNAQLATDNATLVQNAEQLIKDKQILQDKLDSINNALNPIGNPVIDSANSIVSGQVNTANQTVVQ